MFNRIIIIKLFYNVIFLFITTPNQDMFIVYIFIYFIFKFYYLYVCTFMAIGNTSLMLLSINNTINNLIIQLKNRILVAKLTTPFYVLLVMQMI